jgi:hypothetical protein
VLVVTPGTVELVSAGTEVLEPGPTPVVDVGATVEEVGASVVDDATVDVDATVVDVEVGASVVDDATVDVDATVVDVEVGASVVDDGGRVVLGADVDDVVADDAVVVELQCDTRSTDVLWMSEKLSGHVAWTVKTMVPVVPPGTVDTADSFPLAATVAL